MYGERRHRWLIDTGDDRCLGAAFPAAAMSPVDAALFRTKAEAEIELRSVRDEYPDAKIVKVSVRYVPE